MVSSNCPVPVPMGGIRSDVGLFQFYFRSVAGGVGCDAIRVLRI